MIVVEVEQPYAHLIVSRQLRALGAAGWKPPREAIGQRVVIYARPLVTMVSSVLARDRSLQFPAAKPGQAGTVGFWRPPPRDKRGRFLTEKRGSSTVVTNLSTLEHTALDEGCVVGTADLVGWAHWEDLTAKRPSATFKPEGERRKIAIESWAVGPYAWVFLDGSPVVPQSIDAAATRLAPHERQSDPSG